MAEAISTVPVVDNNADSTQEITSSPILSKVNIVDINLPSLDEGSINQFVELAQKHGIIDPLIIKWFIDNGASDYYYDLLDLFVERNLLPKVVSEVAPSSIKNAEQVPVEKVKVTKARKPRGEGNTVTKATRAAKIEVDSEAYWETKIKEVSDSIKDETYSVLIDAKEFKGKKIDFPQDKFFSGQFTFFGKDIPICSTEFIQYAYENTKYENKLVSTVNDLVDPDANSRYKLVNNLLKYIEEKPHTALEMEKYLITEMHRVRIKVIMRDLYNFFSGSATRGMVLVQIDEDGVQKYSMKPITELVTKKDKSQLELF